MKDHYHFKMNDFEKVLKLVKDGISIEKAVAFIGVHRYDFYSSLTPIQRQELKAFKLIYGSRSSGTKHLFLTPKEFKRALGI